MAPQAKMAALEHCSYFMKGINLKPQIRALGILFNYSTTLWARFALSARVPFSYHVSTSRCGAEGSFDWTDQFNNQRRVDGSALHLILIKPVCLLVFQLCTSCSRFSFLEVNPPAFFPKKVDCNPVLKHNSLRK